MKRLGDVLRAALPGWTWAHRVSLGWVGHDPDQRHCLCVSRSRAWCLGPREATFSVMLTANDPRIVDDDGRVSGRGWRERLSGAVAAEVRRVDVGGGYLVERAGPDGTVEVGRFVAHVGDRQVPGYLAEPS